MSRVGIAAVRTEPEGGQQGSALSDLNLECQSGILIQPTVGDARDGIAEAFRREALKDMLGYNVLRLKTEDATETDVSENRVLVADPVEVREPASLELCAFARRHLQIEILRQRVGRVEQ